MRRTWSTVERGRRKASRIALYLSLAAMAAFLASIPPLLRWWETVRIDNTWHGVAWSEVPEVRLLADYLRIDTSWDTGNEIAGARFLAEQLRRAGLAVELEIMGPRQANLWAVLEGRRREALVLHNHIDTDPLGDPSHWAYPPLSGAIEPPWIYGRGVFDMKSVAIAQLVAIQRLAASGKIPERSVVFLATGSEEVGSELGTRWVLAARPELAARFWGVLTEGGVVEATTTRDIKYWGIETAQRHLVEVFVCASPERLADLHTDVNRLFHGQIGLPAEQPRLVSEVREVFGRYARTRSIGELRALIEDPERPLADPTAFADLPGYLRSHLVAEATSFGGEEQLRLVPLFLPGDEVAQVLPRVLPAWLTHGTQLVTVGMPRAPRGSPTNHPLYQLAAATVREHHPRAAVGPYFLPYSVTDARFFRAAGIPAYGFSPFLILSTDTLQVGQPNERMTLEAFLHGVEIYSDLVVRTVAQTGGEASSADRN
jgi:acetylornithine deacetylase/succinyl-diaminopimelate desuccinylase-like protein